MSSLNLSGEDKAAMRSEAEYGEWNKLRPGVWERHLKWKGLTFVERKWECQDCGNGLHVPFMVEDDVWDEYAPEGGILCLPCFDARTGHELVLSDLKDTPANTPYHKGVELLQRESVVCPTLPIDEQASAEMDALVARRFDEAEVEVIGE